MTSLAHDSPVGLSLLELMGVAEQGGGQPLSHERKDCANS